MWQFYFQFFEKPSYCFPQWLQLFTFPPTVYSVSVSRSVVADSLRPHGLQPTRFHCPWNSPGKNTGVGCHFLLQCMKVKSESEVTQSCLTLSDPMDCSLPGSSSMGFSRQEYWSGVPLLSLNPKTSLSGNNLNSVNLLLCILGILPVPSLIGNFFFFLLFFPLKQLTFLLLSIYFRIIMCSSHSREKHS